MRVTDIEATNRILANFNSSIEMHKGGLNFPQGEVFDNAKSAYLRINTRTELVIEVPRKSYHNVDEAANMYKDIKPLIDLMTMLESVN